MDVATPPSQEAELSGRISVKQLGTTISVATVAD
jgi:hypothetical protein